MLLGEGVSSEFANIEDKTALIYAAEQNHPITATYLLKSGCSLDYTNQTNQTALDIARKHGSAAVTSKIELEIKKRNTPNLMDSVYRTTNCYLKSTGKMYKQAKTIVTAKPINKKRTTNPYSKEASSNKSSKDVVSKPTVGYGVTNRKMYDDFTSDIYDDFTQ